MRLALRADKLDHLGSLTDRLLAGFHLAVEDSKGIALQPPLAIFAQLKGFASEELLQFFPIPRPAFPASQGIELEFQLFEAYLFQELDKHGDDFSIDHGIPNTEDFRVDLVELTVSAFLGPFVPEHGSHEVELGHRVKGIKLVFEIGPRERGCSLRPERQRIAASVGEGVHLFFDDIRGFADPPGKKLRPFNDRDAHFRKAESLENVPGGLFDKLPFPDFIGEDIIESTNGFDIHDTVPAPFFSVI
jgi:hypothetical protein